LIFLAQEALILCEHPGCINEQPGRFVLMADGTFRAVPRSQAWQLSTAPGGIGPYRTRCPEHHIQPKPEAPTEATP
jgi:hypothetical protein